MDLRQVTPYLIAALVVWSIYRRMRRSFGRQRVRDGFLWLRIGILTLLAALIGTQVARDVDLLGILLAGIAGGVVLGYFGLKHTKFEVTPEGRFYTPHTYIGLAVTAPSWVGCCIVSWACTTVWLPPPGQATILRPSTGTIPSLSQ